MHDFVFWIFEKSLGLSHHPLIKLIALVQEWMLAAKDNHVPRSCLHQRKKSGPNVRCTEYREISECGESFAPGYWPVLTSQVCRVDLFLSSCILHSKSEVSLN